jgi:tetratricopeptide (TPR) repeat protein
MEKDGAPVGGNTEIVDPKTELYLRYEQALRLLHEKEYRQASDLFTQIRRSAGAEVEVLASIDGHLQQKETPPGTADALVDQGVVCHNAGDFERAMSCYQQALDLAHGGDDEYLRYAMAATQAAMGDTAKALQNLKKAVQLRGEMRFVARNDPDFAALTENPEFSELFRPQKAGV